MLILAIDIGSSSVKMSFVRNGKAGRIVRQPFASRFEGGRAEIDARAVREAMTRAAKQVVGDLKKVDAIALDTLGPSWVAMDRRGKAITPIVTHQDRRSVEMAERLSQRGGKERFVKIAGNVPVPGGISATTCAWFLQNQKSVMKRADLIGHLPTLLHRQLCGTRVIDPSQASFTGLYETIKLGGWSEELCDAVGVSEKLLPEIKQADQVGGKLSATAANELGVREGTPMLTGMIDTSGAMVVAGMREGQLVNVMGSTDVLAVCTKKPKPRQGLLTRALGVDGWFMVASTLAAAGSSLTWAHKTLFADLDDKAYFKLTDDDVDPGLVRFDPYLSGLRASVEQKQAAFTGLTLATTREQMLAAIVTALSDASGHRIESLRSIGTRLLPKVMVSGGGDGLAKIMHRHWPRNWKYHTEIEATLRGSAMLAERL